MQSLAIIEQLNVLKDLRPRLVSCRKITMVNEFVLERTKETLSHRIAGINLRGLSAAAIGRRSVSYLAFDSAADADNAVSILRKALR